MTTQLQPFVIAVGYKAPQSATFAVITRPAAFALYCDGALLNVRHQLFEACATWAEQRGWLDSQHSRSIPDGDDPDDYEDQRIELYARHNVQMAGAL